MEKNTPLRNRIASRIRELRTWPLVSPHHLRRPKVEDTLLSVEGPVSIDSLLRKVQDVAGLKLEDSIADPLNPRTRVSPILESIDLSQVLISADYTQTGDEPLLSLKAYQLVNCTDRQFAKRVDALWSRYQQDSLACDDTDAQYKLYLGLKAIYEPADEA